MKGSGESGSQPKWDPGEESQLPPFPKVPHAGQTHWKGRFRPQARVGAAQGGRGWGLRGKVAEARGLPYFCSGCPLSPPSPSPQGLGNPRGTPPTPLPPPVVQVAQHLQEVLAWVGVLGDWGVLGASWFGETCG